MPAIEPSGSVAENRKSKKDIVNRAICPYNAHRHHNSLALEQVFMEAVGSSPRRFRLLQAIVSFLPYYGKAFPSLSEPQIML